MIAKQRRAQHPPLSAKLQNFSDKNRYHRQFFDWSRALPRRALVQKTAVICGQTPADTASALGMGVPVFEDYPGEAAGVLDGKKTTATAVQVSQVLATIASGGNAVPLTLVMSAMKEKSIPCMEMTGDEVTALELLCVQLAEKPLIGDSWAVGYSGTYAIVVYLEKGEVAEIYSLMQEGSAN